MRIWSRWLGIVLDDWQRRLSALFTGLLLLQFVRWIDEENGIWLKDTVILVEWTLAVVCLLELLPRMRLRARLPLQAAALVVFFALALGYRPVGGSIRSWRAAGDLFLNNAGQLHPFIWFGLGAWIVYTVAVWWVTRKWRIVLLLFVSVAAMSIRDSFSLLVLWDEAAIVILCGLSLLVICHFNGLKKKNPVGWAYLAEYPISAAAPVVLVVALVMTVGVLMPQVRPVLTDPYTLWMEWKGQPVPALGKGVSVAGALPAGSSTSGYSRNDNSLGGGFDFNYDTVMTVDTTHRSYWRGETRSVYNGKGWEQSDADAKGGVSGVAADTELPADPQLKNDKLKTIEVKQTVTIEKPDVYPVLFGSYMISKLESIDGDKGGFDRITWSSRQSELRWAEPKGGKTVYPKTYTVVSQMPVLDEAGLRSATAALPPQMDEYLQLPSTLPARVRDLALEITSGATNPYDKVKLIEQYLQQTYPYTNKPDLSKGKSKDFVDRFLFEIKEGYCDYYSTAMAVMTRAIGIPSRWVKGYAPGQPPQSDLLEQEILNRQTAADPDGAGVYTVRNSDAHSWVEVYFPGWGWYPFEPTAGFAMPTAVLPDAPAAAPDDVTTIVPEPTNEVSASAGWSNRKTVAAGSLLLLLVGAGVVAWRTRRRMDWAGSLRRFMRTRSEASLNQRVVAEYNRLIRLSRRKGYPVFEHETVRETIDRWGRKDAWLSKDLEIVAGLFEKAKYSGRSVSADDYADMTRLVKKLRQEL